MEQRSYHSSHHIWPHFLWTECAVIGRSYGELGRFTAFNHFTAAATNHGHSVQKKRGQIRCDERYELSWKQSVVVWLTIFIGYVSGKPVSEPRKQLYTRTQKRARHKVLSWPTKKQEGWRMGRRVGVGAGGWLSFLDVGQDADAVGGAGAGAWAAHEHDRLVRLENLAFVGETHRELETIVYVLLPLRRLRLWNRIASRLRTMLDAHYCRRCRTSARVTTVSRAKTAEPSEIPFCTGGRAGQPSVGPRNRVSEGTFCGLQTKKKTSTIYNRSTFSAILQHYCLMYLLYVKIIIPTQLKQKMKQEKRKSVASMVNILATLHY